LAPLTGFMLPAGRQDTLHVYSCTPVHPNDHTSQALPTDGRSISFFACVDKLTETSLGFCHQSKPECRC